MVVDEDGTVHPTDNDEFTLEGCRHIHKCERCRSTFGPIVVGYADYYTEHPDEWGRIGFVFVE